MATVTWTLQTGGDWSNTLGWSTGAVPGASDTADFPDTLNSGLVITITEVEAVATANVGATSAILEIRPGGSLSASQVSLTGSDDAIEFDTSQTLSGTLNLDPSLPTPAEFLSIASDDTLTIGDGAVLDMADGNPTVGNFGGTLINDGQITFTSGFGTSLEVDPDSLINAGFMGVGYIGTVTGAFQSGISADIDPQSLVSLAATGSFAFGFGTEDLNSGSGTVDLEGSTTVEFGGSLTIQAVAIGDGQITIQDAGTLDLTNYAGTIDFGPGTVTGIGPGSDDMTDQYLDLAQPGSFTAPINGFKNNPPTPADAGGGVITHDFVDLLNTQVTGFVPYQGDASSGTLTVLDNSATVATLNLIGDYIDTQFTFEPDQAGTGTDIYIASPLCFAAGTRIATPRGDTPVERLRAGHAVLTAEGDAAPILWIDHKRFDCGRHPDPALLWPVRVRAGAFGPARPRRDLFLSPDHAVFVEDVLIPVKHLIDGDRIAQVPVASVDYYHIKLDQHELVLAEGLAVESFLGRDIPWDRFAADRAPRNGVPALWEALGYAPLIVTGPKLTAARAASQHAV
jgi:hypothetical protein